MQRCACFQSTYKLTLSQNHSHYSHHLSLFPYSYFEIQNKQTKAQTCCQLTGSQHFWPLHILSSTLLHRYSHYSQWDKLLSKVRFLTKELLCKFVHSCILGVILKNKIREVFSTLKKIHQSHNAPSTDVNKKLFKRAVITSLLE